MGRKTHTDTWQAGISGDLPIPNPNRDENGIFFFDLTKGVVVWLGSIFGRLIYRRTACYIFARLFLNYYTFQNVANTQNVK